MKPVTRITIIVLGAAFIAVTVLVMREALGGTTFRAGDYDTYDECIANIPREWLPGSLERSGAETACHYEAQRRSRGG
jgi:hypothetical protein